MYSRYKRKGEACLVFETFLRAMISIAKNVHPDMQPMDALKMIFPSTINDSHIATIKNRSLWEKDVRLIRTLAPNFSRVYPLYWKNELVFSKDKS
jgi:hypothetical protein